MQIERTNTSSTITLKTTDAATHVTSGGVGTKGIHITKVFSTCALVYVYKNENEIKHNSLRKLSKVAAETAVFGSLDE